MTAAEQLRACCAVLDRACDRLTEATPESLDACSGFLQDAIERLAYVGPALRGGDAVALAEVSQLKRSTRRASALLASANTYHRLWQHSIRIQTAGYGPDGSPGRANVSGRISMRA